ncbi:MAG: hypothetical protein M1482_16075 [Chloroflexi bacterium]|nr:hypothetical protein [Chloroflexota bacterium]
MSTFAPLKLVHRSRVTGVGLDLAKGGIGGEVIQAVHLGDIAPRGAQIGNDLFRIDTQRIVGALTVGIANRIGQKVEHCPGTKGLNAGVGAF